MEEEYEYTCPDNLDEQTEEFFSLLVSLIGPYGVARDESLRFVQESLLAPPTEQIVLLCTADEFLDVYAGV